MFSGFLSFERFWVSSLSFVFEFPYSTGDCTGFLSVNGVGAGAAFGAFPLSPFCVLGRFPSLLHEHTLTRTHTYTSGYHALTQKKLTQQIPHLTQKKHTLTHQDNAKKISPTKIYATYVTVFIFGILLDSPH